MKLLQRLLKLQAAVWAIWGGAIMIAPAWLLESVMRQPPLSQYAWLRACGVMAIVLALLMVLVVQRIDDLWWWSWAFAVLELGTGTVFALTALFGVPAGAATWPWWALTFVSGALGAGLLVGLGYAGQERPFA
jgi:hypothetical protein